MGYSKYYLFQKRKGGITVYMYFLPTPRAYGFIIIIVETMQKIFAIVGGSSILSNKDATGPVRRRPFLSLTGTKVTLPHFALNSGQFNSAFRNQIESRGQL